MDFPESEVDPNVVKAALAQGHVSQVVIYCDLCGKEEVMDMIGKTSEIRFNGARRTLVKHEGWQCDSSGDWCKRCKAVALAD